MLIREYQTLWSFRDFVGALGNGMHMECSGIVSGFPRSTSGRRHRPPTMESSCRYAGAARTKSAVIFCNLSG